MPFTFQLKSFTIHPVKKIVLAVALTAFSSLAIEKPEFTGKDVSRKRIAVQLQEWATGFKEPTDVQFVPGDPATVLVLEKAGTLLRVTKQDPKVRSAIWKRPVKTSSEMGLLGMAFHPDFARNRKIYLNYNPEEGAKRTRISELVLDLKTYQAGQERILLEVAQPYPNHKAGQLVFGPDKMLYIGLGDGGFANDPQNHGQRTDSLLGKILRIDVTADAKKPYCIPTDNPFVSDKKYAPEIWAVGIRNPWRYTFDPTGRLIVADVGQNLWEEVTFVTKGSNQGWRVKEASHCFQPEKNCPAAGMNDPWLEYGRDDGASITGGYVYQGKALPALKGKYVFGDYVSGRVWAADLPAAGAENKTTTTFEALGRWPIQISTFGRDGDGEIYLADFSGGAIYRVGPP